MQWGEIQYPIWSIILFSMHRINLIFMKHSLIQVRKWKNYEDWCMNIIIRRLHKIIHPHILYTLHGIYFFFSVQLISLASESKGIVQKKACLSSTWQTFQRSEPLQHTDLEPKVSIKTLIMYQKFTSWSLIFHFWWY